MEGEGKWYWYPRFGEKVMPLVRTSSVEDFFSIMDVSRPVSLGFYIQTVISGRYLIDTRTAAMNIHPPEEGRRQLLFPIYV